MKKELFSHRSKKKTLSKIIRNEKRFKRYDNFGKSSEICYNASQKDKRQYKNDDGNNLPLLENLNLINNRSEQLNEKECK